MSDSTNTSKESPFKEWGNRINLLGIIIGVLCLLIPRSWATIIGVVIIFVCGSLIIWHLPWVEAFNGRRLLLITALGISCALLGRSTLRDDPKPQPPVPYILTRLVIDSVDKDDVAFHLQIDNGNIPIKGIRAAYHTNNFTVDPEVIGNGYGEIATFMPRMLPPQGTLSIPGQTKFFNRDKETTLTVMIGFRTDTGATNSTDFTAVYRFLVRPEDIKPQTIHPEGAETKEQEFNDQAMRRRIVGQTFQLREGMISFDVDETKHDGSPNMIRAGNEYRRWSFDPINRLVTFQMKTSSGKVVTLELPLPIRKDKRHDLTLAWDYSQGGYLVVDGIVRLNMNGQARTLCNPQT